MTDYSELSISAYVADSLNADFTGRKEFILHPVCQSDRWLAFRDAVREASMCDDDVIAICLDGHRFTEDYHACKLLSKILRGAELGTHLLIGGCISFGFLVPVTYGLYWVDRFDSANFYIVYRQAFQMIVEAKAEPEETLEHVLSRLLPNKLLAVPFLSISAIDDGRDALSRLRIFQHAAQKYNIFKQQ